MRSGIGPKDELAKLGIEPKVILEGVGKNQGDRYEVGVVVRMKKPFELLKKLKKSAETRRNGAGRKRR